MQMTKEKLQKAYDAALVEMDRVRGEREIARKEAISLRSERDELRKNLGHAIDIVYRVVQRTEGAFSAVHRMKYTETTEPDQYGQRETISKKENYSEEMRALEYVYESVICLRSEIRS